MTSRLALLSLTCTLSLTGTAFPCSIGMFGTTPMDRTRDMVARAELIVRATAVAYAVAPIDPRIRTNGPTESRVRFVVQEVIKGTEPPKEIVLEGFLETRDEWNRQPPPYESARASADAACFSNMYREGGQFLLVLVRAAGVRPSPLVAADTTYTVNWLALAPVNEQLRSADDPWLAWVREQTKAR